MVQESTRSWGARLELRTSESTYPGAEIGQRRRRLSRLLNDKAAAVGALLVIGIGLAGVLAPWLSPYDPTEQNMARRLERPSAEHLLGTDEFGRDVLSRVIWGARPSLMVGLLAVGVSMPIGTLIGAVAGYKQGWVDAIVVHLTDSLLSLPAVVLGLMIVAVLGPGATNLIVAIATSLVPKFIRVARAPAIALSESDFIIAARAIGARDSTIILFHIIPNIVGPATVMTTLYIATAILTEASLSFLGLGIQPPTPSWGNMLRSGIDRILFAPWLALYPGLAIVLTVLGFNLIGDAVRDAVDPKLQGS